MRGSAERRADQKIGRARHLRAQINATRIGEAGAFTVAVSSHARSSIFDVNTSSLNKAASSQDKDKHRDEASAKQGELGCSGRIGKKDIHENLP